MSTVRKLLFICALLLLLAALGCERKMDTVESVPQVPRSGAVPIDVKAFVNNEAIALNWSVTDASDVRRYRVYVSENDTLNYVLRDSTADNSISVTNLQINRRYYFKIAALMNNGVEWYRSAPVTAYLGRLGIALHGGAEYTRSRDINVRFNAPDGLSDVILSERSDFADAAWQNFGGPISFTLSDGDGAKTVFARLQFQDGSQSGDVLSDDITLDTYCHIQEVRFEPTGQTFTGGDTILFQVETGETGGEAGVSFGDYGAIPLNDDGLDGDLVPGDGVYSYRYLVPVSINTRDATVSGQCTDAAGNEAMPRAAEALLSIAGTAPRPVELIAIVGSDNTEADLTWTTATTDAFAYYRVVKGTATVALISNRATTSYTYEFLSSDNGNVCFVVEVVDIAGQEAASTPACVTAPD